MYIWVVLATFLAILASYTLSPRDDIRKLTVEPLAEAYIAKMVTQHQAARSYVRYHKKPYTSDGQPQYKHGMLGEFELEAHFPPAHHYADYGGDFASKIYCMNADGTAVGDVATNEACKVKENKKVLVTFAPIPLRWLNYQANPPRPSNDFMNAMRNTIDSGAGFGYTAPVEEEHLNSPKNISHSDVRIVDRDNAENYLFSGVVADGDFADVCNISEEKICLVYQSNI